MFIQEKLDSVEELSQSIETRHICLHEKLKTMFGHPKNARFLNELETELNSLEESSQNDLFDRIKTLRVCLLDSRKHIKKFTYLFD